MTKKTNCSWIVTLHHAHPSLMEDIWEEISDHDLIFDELPMLPYAFPNLGNEVKSDPFDPYPPVSCQDLDKPTIYLHSSGSTGFPKPIVHSYKVQIHLLTQCCMLLPPFHALGLAAQLHIPIASLITATIYPPCSTTDPHTPPVIPLFDNILDSLQRTKCNLLVTVPTFLEQWAMSKDTVEELKKMHLILFGGGPLPVKVGNALCAAGVPIALGYGGTEFSNPLLLPDRKDIEDGDWLWMCPDNNITIRWASQGDGTYECQVLTTENNQMAVENLPDIKGYATSDLFMKHPIKDMWKIVRRTDDIIMLVSGEKTMPAPMEGIIGSKHVVDIQDDKAIAEFKNKIWCVYYLEANKTALAFSRIFKEIILIMHHDKPMLRTPKGTVQKKATVKAYESEIDAFLSVTYLRNQLINAMQKSQNPNIQCTVSCLSLNIVFENLTIKQLAARISSIVSGGASQTLDPKEQQITAMNAMIEKYAFGLNGMMDGIPINGVTNGEMHPAINQMVERMYALNRPSSSTSIEEGLSIDLLCLSKLVYVEADTSQDRLHFGLDSPCKNLLRFMFTSSVSSAQSWDRGKGLFPEEVQLDPSVASKYVCEQIIIKSGLHATLLCIGQIVGGRNGSWTMTDWVAIIVKSSITLGALPHANGIMSCISVLDIAFVMEMPPPALNIVNPRGAPWADVMSSVQDAILMQKSMGSEELLFIPFKDWFALLEKKVEGATSEDLVNIPAIKLLEFFHSMACSDEGTWAHTEIQTVNMEASGMASFSTAKSQLVSETISLVQPVGVVVEAHSWVQHWILKGFL
ncbi:putative nonribosomal peptide synthetase [Melanogaster broomeanus]|nr:putative nonribosomal peptide synthetase [Melanogaster broomeanus]